MLARDSDGVVYEWGKLPYGYAAIHAPVQKAGALEGVKAERIFQHKNDVFFALSDAGELYAWGSESVGLLGTGQNGYGIVTDPVKVEGELAGVPMQTVFPGCSDKVFAL